METKRKREESATCVVCPIVYGSLAHFLGKKSEEATHKWTLFVRGPNDEDLSTFVAQVCFSLHPSFAEPLRSKFFFLIYVSINFILHVCVCVCMFIYIYYSVVDRAPFEVTEFGWGEFEAGIRIIFKDKSEQPIDIAHHLKLYPPLTDKPGASLTISKKVCILCNIIFTTIAMNIFMLTNVYSYLFLHLIYMLSFV